MALKRIVTGDQNLQLIQDNVAAALPPDQTTLLTTTLGVNGQPATVITKTSPPFIGGNLITPLPLVSGQDNLISHGLGRAPLAWVVVGINASATVWNPTTTKLAVSNGAASLPANSTYINLQCSANCTVTLWVR